MAMDIGKSKSWPSSENVNSESHHPFGLSLLQFQGMLFSEYDFVDISLTKSLLSSQVGSSQLLSRQCDCLMHRKHVL